MHKWNLKGDVRRAAALAAAMMMGAATPLAAFAGAPAASVDETLYLNLGSYGSVNKASVVKGINFNSNDSYTDYGNYTNVTNMSNQETPVLGDGSVTFKAPENNSKLFFEGELDPSTVKVPWTFDLTYKLNGVEKKAEDLAGASGLVEIDIDAFPDKSVSEYIQNNFMLFIMLPVDLSDKNYSVDAPDSQTMTIGQISGVVFEALPGKEVHYQCRIGTDSFEMSGIYFVMAPGTVGDLKDLKDLKDVEDKFRDNSNSMMDALESMLDNASDTKDQLTLTNEMLANLQKGKNKVSAAKSGIFNGTDVSIADVRELSSLLTPISDSIKTVEWMVYDSNRVLNNLDQDLLSTNTRLKNMSEKLHALGSSLGGVDNLTAAEINSELKDLNQSLTKVASDSDMVGKEAAAQSVINYSVADISNSNAKSLVRQAMNANKDSGKELDRAEVAQLIYLGENGFTSYDEVMNKVFPAMRKTDTLTYLMTLGKEKAVPVLAEDLEISPAEAKALLELAVAKMQDAKTKNEQATETLLYDELPEADTVISRYNEAVKSAEGIQAASDALNSSSFQNSDSVRQLLNDLLGGYDAENSELGDVFGSENAQEMVQLIAQISSEIEDISSDAGAAAFSTARFLNQARELNGDIDELVGVMNNYYQDIQDALSRTDAVVTKVQNTSEDLSNVLQDVNNLLRSASDDFDKAADEGISAGKKITEQAGKISQDASDLNSAEKDLRKSINDELDEKEAENNFINMDPEAEKLSFTSDKNQEPSSLAIVCRTDEIKIPDQDKALDSETESASTTAWQRIVNLFVRIFKALKSAFSDD